MKIIQSPKIKITRFFEETLGAKLNHHVQSWGAEDQTSNRVFLRVWEHNMQSDSDGEKVQVDWKEKKSRSPGYGYGERRKHLEAIQRGALGIGILCKAVDQKAKITRIKSYDGDQLLVLGDIIDDDKVRYARIVRRIPISELADSTLVSDIKSIISNKATDPTTIEALVTARVGQGKFGWAVRKLWSHQCSVTGSTTKAALEASHIQPWAHSDDAQRLDPNNGLLLTANLHKLFDAGLIAFEASGKMVISSKLSSSEQEIYGVIGKKLSKTPSVETANYLLYHRAKIFFD